MEVKEAIKFLNKDKSSMAYPWDDKIQNWQDRIVVINQVITLLRRGEAYKLMWIMLKSTPLIDDRIVGLMNKYEQKYFPKED